MLMERLDGVFLHLKTIVSQAVFLSIIYYYIYITFKFCHLADAFIQSDLQMRTRSNQNQQKSNDMQVL